jgi:hypothetical protein
VLVTYYQHASSTRLGAGKGTYLPEILYTIHRGRIKHRGANNQKFPCLKLTVAEDAVSIVAESLLT